MINGRHPSIIILVGIPGSGKTTYAKYLEEYGYVHISSDMIRKDLYGDESIQGNPEEVFHIMNTKTVELLNNGENVVYDATNVSRKDRARIISMCPKHCKILCHIVWAPIITCIQRDAERNRHVGKQVIDRMLKRFQAPYYDEGFSEINVVNCSGQDFDKNKYAEKCMNDMKISHDNPHHTLGIYDHSNSAYNYCIDHGYNKVVAVSALWHDVGKPYTKSFLDSRGEKSEIAHYYQHQCVGAWMSYGLFSYELFGENTFIDVAWMISTHMDPYLETKYYKNLPNCLKSDIDCLHEADEHSH